MFKIDVVVAIEEGVWFMVDESVKLKIWGSKSVLTRQHPAYRSNDLRFKFYAETTNRFPGSQGARSTRRRGIVAVEDLEGRERRACLRSRSELMGFFRIRAASLVRHRLPSCPHDFCFADDNLCNVQTTLWVKFCRETTYRLPASKVHVTASSWGAALWWACLKLNPSQLDTVPTNFALRRRIAFRRVGLSWPPFEGDSGLGNGVEWLTCMEVLDLHECVVVDTKVESFRAHSNFFGQIGPTTASFGFPLERFQRETTLGRRTNGRMPPPVCAFDEYLRDGEIMIL
ncbi:hypothetical protein EV421DRAFT_1735349 [Armillaria borealis]|uniref:Uncharacterized protein n=1 Tax=Armillaria borealis TaxID=47425 RepID=A0AA39JMI3_9AGAR|nr:hypothetical protein EV421DRAFT_1735349 [Armillaria borealis]